MQKTLITFLILMSFSISAQAKRLYVTDTIKYTLRSSESNRSKILKMLPSGSVLTVIKENKNSGYTKVRTNAGVEGYILTRHTQDKPISLWYLNRANKKLESLQQEYDLIKQELNQLKGNNNDTLSTNQSLTKERDTLSQELNNLRQTAANAVQLKHDRDQSRKKIIELSNQLKEVTHENQMLSDSTNQDWFLYGGILSLFGVILGFILPKLSWRTKKSNWDTF